MPSLLELLGQTWPARMAQSAWGAVTLPGDVYAGKVDPLSDEGIGRAADLAGTVMGGTYASAPRGAVGAGPIRAYHGSPHDFERFDLSKIGTGEGAQSYGHGLYFAENPATAQSYRDALAGGPQKQIAGLPYDSKNPEHLASSLLETYARKDDPRATAIAALKYDISNPNLTDAARAHYRSVVDLLSSGKPLPDVSFKPSGRMYEVNINAAPEQMLPWDAPLPMTHPARAAALDAIPKSGLFTPEPEATLRGTSRDMIGNVENLSGERLYSALERRLGSSPKASDVLKEAGIPGIKYLDQGSRSAGYVNGMIAQYGTREKALEVAKQRLEVANNTFGKQAAFDRQSWQKAVDQLQRTETSNYVLFRDDIIDIVKKYGLAGAAAMYGISQDEAKAAMDEKPKLQIGRQSYGE